MGRIQSGVAEREAHSVCDTWDTQPHSSVKIHKGGLSDSLNSEHLVKNCRAGDSRRNQVIYYPLLVGNKRDEPWGTLVFGNYFASIPTAIRSVSKTVIVH